MGAAGLGARVALVERAPARRRLPEHRLRAVEGAAAIGARGGRRAAGAGGSASASPASSADFAAVMRRMRERRADISPHDSAERLRAAGVDVYFGDARFTGAIDASTSAAGR